jgi:hypothetical protein
MAARLTAIHANELPDEFLTAVAFLLPYLNKLAQEECGITIGAIFVMMHLTISGKRVDGRYTMLRNDLTNLLGRRGFSDAGASRLLQGLQDSGYIQRTFVSAAVRQEQFEPGERANTQAVILMEGGEQKIDDFKAALRMHFGHWLSNELKKETGKKRDWLAKWVRGLLVSDLSKKLAMSLVERIAKAEMARE